MPTGTEFIQLFLPVQGDLLAYILALGVPAQDADDVLQSSAAVLFQKFDKFEEGSNFRAWAFAVVRYEVLSWMKRSRRKSLAITPEVAEDLAAIAQDDAEAPPVLQKALNSCLERLSEPARNIIRMRYHESLSVGEIASRLRRSPASISTTFFRIRHFLHGCVGKLDAAGGETP
jgi:RNA polymerase sigma-70 factor (ECF subfamily)